MRVRIQVAEKRDFRQVMDQLAVDVQHQIRHRQLRVRFLVADRDQQPLVAQVPTPASHTSSCALSWSSAAAALPAYSHESYDAGRAPKCDALRAASTPTMTCPSRHAIVVNGAGTGSGWAKSIVKSPEPA